MVPRNSSKVRTAGIIPNYLYINGQSGAVLILLYAALVGTASNVSYPFSCVKVSYISGRRGIHNITVHVQRTFLHRGTQWYGPYYIPLHTILGFILVPIRRTVKTVKTYGMYCFCVHAGSCLIWSPKVIVTFFNDFGFKGPDQARQKGSCPKIANIPYRL